MILTEKETNLIKDLQTQEKLCIEKYKFYGCQAKDQELKNLFGKIEKVEQQHYDSLGQVLSGTVPAVDGKDTAPQNYCPTASYVGVGNAEDKNHDKFLCTDCIATEKYVSSAYNNDLFQFASNDVRKLLNDIQTEEQGHAEMIYKYKTVNGMTEE